MERAHVEGLALATGHTRKRDGGARRSFVHAAGYDVRRARIQGACAAGAPPIQGA
jgi:hypothetical protein